MSVENLKKEHCRYFPRNVRSKSFLFV